MAEYDDVFATLEQAVPKFSGIEDARLFTFHVVTNRLPEESQQIGARGADLAMKHEFSGDRSSVSFQIRLRMAIVGDDDEAPFFTFEIEYGMLYGLKDPEDPPTGPELEAFGRLVAVPAVWPYLRAQLSQTSLLMGMTPAVMLPMMTLAQFAEALSTGDERPDVGVDA